MGIGGCGQPMTAPLFLSYLRALFPFSIAGPSHGLQSFRINLLRCGISMGCSSFRACPPSPAWSPPGAAGESLLGCLENLLCSSFSDFSVCRAVSHTFSPCSSLPGSVLHFLTQAFHRVPPSCLRGSAVPYGGWVGAVWNWLCLAPQPPASTWAPAPCTLIALTKISVQLRLGTKAETAHTEKQGRPITSLAKPIGKIMSMHALMPVL